MMKTNSREGQGARGKRRAASCHQEPLAARPSPLAPRHLPLALLALASAAFGAESSIPLKSVVTTNFVVTTNIVVVTNLVVSTNTVLATGAASGSEPDVFGLLWWKEGLNYRLTQRIGLGKTNQLGIPLLQEQLSMSGRLGIKGAFDGAAFASARGQAPVDNDMEVRTARFYTTGDFTWRFPTYFKLELGVVSESFYLHEAYLRFKEVPYIKNLTIGYIGAPLTMENLMAFGDLTFMEAAAPAQAFGPGNRSALQIDGTWLNERMSYTAGFYGTGLDPTFNFGDASQSLARGMARVTGLPIYQDDTNDFRLLHLGAAVSYVFSDSSDLRYQARPESHLAPFLVDTGDIQAQNATQLGLEAAYVKGPFSLQSELTGSWIADATTGRTTQGRTFWGAYGYASWFLTGEHRVYDKSGGVFGRLTPTESLSPVHSHWGALEVGVRFSHLNLSDGPIDGGRMEELMPGLNWYWSKHVRLQANYGYARVHGGQHPGDLHLFQTRLQVFY